MRVRVRPPIHIVFAKTPSLIFAAILRKILPTSTVASFIPIHLPVSLPAITFQRDARIASQLIDRAQRIVAPTLVEPIVKELLIPAGIILHREPRQALKTTPSRLATTVGNGERQTHIVLSEATIHAVPVITPDDDLPELVAKPPCNTPRSSRFSPA
jgi:hypothetical protein